MSSLARGIQLSRFAASPIRSATACLVLLALSTAPHVARADQLGRLFFTPEYRATLERQRQFNLQQAKTVEGSTLTVDGIVRRSSGKSTVWVNGVAQEDNAPLPGMHVQVDPRDPSRARLAAGQETPTELRVGESVSRSTRETTDALNGGLVGVSRSGEGVQRKR